MPLEFEQTDLVENRAVGVRNSLDGFWIVVEGIDDSSVPVDGFSIVEFAMVRVLGIGHATFNHPAESLVGFRRICAGRIIDIPERDLEQLRVEGRTLDKIVRCIATAAHQPTHDLCSKERFALAYWSRNKDRLARKQFTLQCRNVEPLKPGHQIGEGFNWVDGLIEELG